MDPLLLVLLVALAVAFAYSIGAHYTGACMGMPYAAGAIRLAPALLVMAPLTFVGAIVASEGVEQTVGNGLLEPGTVSVPLAIAIVLSALVLTGAYNFLTLPTSTIQILVFSTVGAGIAAGTAIDWRTVEHLLELWAVAPFVAFALGYLFVRLGDRNRARTAGHSGLTRNAALALVLVGAAASFAMGANDVSNASGALIMTGQFGLLAAAATGGLGLAIGVLTWGRPLLEGVAFRIVRLDGPMAISAQFAQATVILASVAFGLFTSMNQALVGGMIGTGVARGQNLVLWPAVRGILAGWALGPVSGAVLGFGVTEMLRYLGVL
ncbi:MAG TPA: anion permease [Thermoplasmata archaeon]|nr:anion permease [Thermoplasmata archaeon]